jgi:hypothetical protein
MTTLGEIAEPSRARALPAEVPDMRYIGLEHIEPQTMKLLGHGYARDARSSSVRFSKGDVLYGKMRSYLGSGSIERGTVHSYTWSQNKSPVITAAVPRLPVTG